MSLGGRIGARGSLLLASACLAACTVQPHVGGPDGDLRPLAKLPALPPGAPARSEVPSVRYDLAVSGAGEQIPDGGLPGGDNGREVFERGGASWYGLQFHLRRTASGERFDMTALTAAHKTLPFNTRVCVRSLVNGREVLVRINDRGPYVGGRVIDLSRAAADAIGLPGLGIKQVALSVMDKDDDHCGGNPIGDADAAPPPPPDSVMQLFSRARR